MHMYLCVFVCAVCTRECRYLWSPEDGIRSPGSGVRGYILPDVGAGNQTDPLQEQ